MPQNPAATQGVGRHHNWLAVLDAYSVQFLVLDRGRDSDLLRAAQSHPGWTVDFQDGEVVLLARVQTHDGARIAA